MSVLYKQHHGVVPQRRDNVCTYNVRHYLRGSALNKSVQSHHRPQAAEQKWTAEFIKNKTFGEAPGHTLARRVRARGRRLRDPDKCICQCYWNRMMTSRETWREALEAGDGGQCLVPPGACQVITHDADKNAGRVDITAREGTSTREQFKRERARGAHRP